MRLFTGTSRRSNGTTRRTGRARHRIVGLLAVALVVSLATPLATTGAAAAATTDYLDETFSAEPSQWTTGSYDAAIGTRNRLTLISDGADGSATRVTIAQGSHFGSAARWQFSDHGFADPDELYFRYYLRFSEGYVNYGKGKLPGFGGLYSSSGRNNIKPSDTNP